MYSIDITSASWQQDNREINSGIIYYPIEAGTKLTVMAYRISSETALYFTAFFYDAQQTYIGQAGAGGGSYITVPDDAFYWSISLSVAGGTVTASELFSAIVYADVEYTLPMNMPVSIGQGYSPKESNGSIVDIEYDPRTGQQVDENYTYTVTRTGDRWSVTQTVT